MQTAPLLVRPSTPADLDALRDIYALPVTQGTGTFELETPGRWHAARPSAHASDSTNHGSIGLHRELAFERCGLLQAVGWKFGRWLDVVRMQRALGAGAHGAAPDGAA